jgi:glycosyltransferase involved in cell wall biosynthesis
MTPDVSVVIPTKDRWPLLRRAVACARRQCDVAVEVVVVDDGSAEPAPADVREPAGERTQWLRTERSEGVARARNRGIRAAVAPRVAFLDDDDLWAPDHLREVVAAVPPGGSFAFGRHYVVDIAGGVLSRGADPPAERMLEQIVARNPVVTPSAVVADRALLMEVGGFDPRFSITADWDLWIRLAGRGPVGISRALTVGYTNHSGAMHADTARLLGERRALVAKHDRLLRGLQIGLGDELFWQWAASAVDPARQKRLAARWYIRHQRPYAPPWSTAAGLARLARAPRLEDTLLKTAGEPTPDWLRAAAAPVVAEAA